MRFEPVVLEGEYVRLEPLSEEHRQGLCDAIADGELWNLHVTLVPHPSRIDEFLNNAREAYESGDGLAFATVDRVTHRVAGSTRFMRASLPNRRVEIGFTFLGNSWQRTSVNSEAKLLMLTHAFETVDMNRVEFLTDYLNDRSRRAILRLGAKEEGVLRSHMVMPNGRIRDSVLYSIVRSEWPGIKQHLSSKLVARVPHNAAK
jgi:RimJ/RimL family protein N-acetyltransferase